MYSRQEDSWCSGAEAESNSDGEPYVIWGNVSKLMVLPPDHKGPSTRGHLVFDAGFESGNLGRVDWISECEYDLFIRPDTNSPRHRVWFYFSVENVRAEQKVVFNIVNFSKNRSLYREGMAPVVRSSSRPRWQRIPSRHAHFDKSAAHNDQYVISFAFAFDREEDVYYFAYCFPYTYTQLQRHLASLEEKQMPHFRRELLALSKQQRRLDLICITEPENQNALGVKRVIFITSRVHSGESPASYVCQGLMDFLVSDDPMAITLRQNFVFKIIPMLNPDGVYMGNGRCSSLGFDLNRCWDRPTAESQPTIYAAKKLLYELKQNSRTQVDFCIDLHSHSQQLNSFLYGNIFSNDLTRSERQAILPSLLSEIAVDYSLELTQFNKDPTKAGTARRVVSAIFDGHPMCYTLEVSVFGYQRKEQSPEITPYNEDSYKKIGEDLACALYQYLEVERGARSLQMQPFHMFLANSSTPNSTQVSSAMPKTGQKMPVRDQDRRKPMTWANQCALRKSSNPLQTGKDTRLCTRSGYSITGFPIEES